MFAYNATEHFLRPCGLQVSVLSFGIGKQLIDLLLLFHSNNNIFSFCCCFMDSVINCLHHSFNR
jgi:hypothetical protein